MFTGSHRGDSGSLVLKLFQRNPSGFRYKCVHKSDSGKADDPEPRINKGDAEDLSEWQKQEADSSIAYLQHTGVAYSAALYQQIKSVTDCLSCGSAHASNRHKTHATTASRLAVCCSNRERDFERLGKSLSLPSELSCRQTRRLPGPTAETVRAVRGMAPVPHHKRKQPRS